MRRLPLLALVCVLAGCGSTGKADAPRAQRTPPAASPATKQAADRHEPVIRAWAEAVRRSDTAKAATFFTVPAIVNQGKDLRLPSRKLIEAFNAALPCGAKLTRVERDGRYTVGTFQLVERPGQKCDGPGNTAQVAFVFKGDRISEWRQVLAPPDPPADAKST
jgi:predicted small lipoprotein YifL